MKRNLAFIIIFAFLTSSTNQVSAAPKIGSTCTKVSTFQQSIGALLVCDVVKKKKVWRKATSIEKSLYQMEKNRLAKVEAQKIIDDAAAAVAADKVAAEAIVKAAADKATADAAAKAAADKVAVEAIVKAAADKATADAAAKAAADKVAVEAIVKAAADKAAADVFGLNSLATWSGPDPMNEWLGWQWAAVKVSNKSKFGILRSGYSTSTYVDSQGVSVDSNMEKTPTLLPNATGWMVSTIHNLKSVGSTFLSAFTTQKASEIKASELPTISGISFSPSGSGGIVSATIKNNSSSKFLYGATHTNVVFLNSSGVPVYAYWGSLSNSIAPGFTATVDLNAFLRGKLSFIPTGFTSIEVTLGVILCDSGSSSSSCTY